MSEWVSVKDKMPEPFVSVLGYMPDAAPFPEEGSAIVQVTAIRNFLFPR